MEICKTLVGYFVVVVCIMGIPTHAQTTAGVATADTGTTAADTPTAEATTAEAMTAEATGVATTAGITALMETQGTPAAGTSPTPAATPESTGAATTQPPTDAPGTNAPGTNAPGTNAPGTNAPGTNAPGTNAPGTNAPGTNAPGSNAPGTNAPGTNAPGTNAPGTNAPGTNAPGTNAPGTNAPGTNAPGTNAPGTSMPTEAPALKMFEGGFIITQIDGADAVYTDDLANPESQPFIGLSSKVCTAVKAALGSSTPGNDIESCSVSSFKTGSIVAAFLMVFPAATQDISAELTTSLKAAFTNPTDPNITAVTVDTSSITVRELTTSTPTEAPATAKPTTKALPSKEFEGTLAITKINGVDAVFGSDYETPDSKPYTDLSSQVCTAVEFALENSTTGSSLERCNVTGFSKGSIVAAFLMGFPASTQDISAELTASLKEAFTNSTDPRLTALTVDTSSIGVKEVPPTTVKPTEPGLSPGAIAGIAVGSVAAAVIIIGIIVFLVMKCSRQSSKVQDADGQELTRQTSGDKSAQHDQVSNVSEKSS